MVIPPITSHVYRAYRQAAADGWLTTFSLRPYLDPALKTQKPVVEICRVVVSKRSHQHLAVTHQTRRFTVDWLDRE